MLKFILYTFSYSFSSLTSLFQLPQFSKGFQFIMHPELMFMQDVKVLYNSILSDESSLVSLKIQVLKNLQTYLQEEDSRMQEADRECEFNKSTFCHAFSVFNLPQHTEQVIHVL